MLDQLRSRIRRHARANEAEDVLQETLSRAWKLRRGACFDVRWLWGIAKNVLRERSRAPRLLRLEDAWSETLAARRDLHPELDDLLGTGFWRAMGAREREVLVWRYLEGLSTEELAARSGRTVKGTRSLLQRAVNKARLWARARRR